MALVAKRTNIVALPLSEQGQISIFFSASLVVFVTIIAFVINVGLFVKAKINLQNATDAAAFSGAAVQSRQLTKIAYLNWEMRNVYKEWMYKYYVVGNLNAPGVQDHGKSASCNGRKCTDFRLAPDKNAISGATTEDDYNFPAVCIHIASSETNLCKRFAVPGLPEFGGYSIPGTEEASRSFVDTLIGSKLNDCVERSRLNMLITTTWAYNVMSNDMDKSLAGQGPAILSDRQGAWPKAMELAMRIRNLEKVVNRPPAEQPVCIGGIGNCEPIHNYSNNALLGNERIVKAFYTGYRNLGNHVDDEMKNSFTLTELSPTPYSNSSPTSSSNLLIPASESTTHEKRYVDLKLMMVNLATFYAAFVGRAEQGTSAACDISKVAIPVPGYPLGFYKNPDVVTYYAIRGQAEFEGMFNPFSADKIKLTAYAAAKPAGGRIGPKLFTERNNLAYARKDKKRSVPYFSALDVVGTYNRFLDDKKLDEGEFGPGAPLPINISSTRPFWVLNSDDPIGGQSTTSDVQFGIPNLVYDFESINDFDAKNYTHESDDVNVIQPKQKESSWKPVGLMNHSQFDKFRGDIGDTVTQAQLVAQVQRVRGATMYEAANYLIPTPFDVNQQLGVDSWGSMKGPGVDVSDLPDQFTVRNYRMEIYAPLYQEGTNQKDLWYKTSSEVLSATVDFMRSQHPAMENYVRSLNSAAIQTYKTAFEASKAASGAIQLYKKAGLRISDIDIPDLSSKADFSKIPDDLHITGFPKTCNSLSGQFWHFYYGHSDFSFKKMQDENGCPVPMVELLRQYYASSASDPTYSPTHYKMEYSLTASNFPGGMIKRLFSAYMPGPYNGIGMNGELSPPPGFPPHRELMRRNFYSTKLVSLDSVQSGGYYDDRIKNFPIYSEGNLTNSSNSESKSSFVNALEDATLREDEIRY